MAIVLQDNGAVTMLEALFAGVNMSTSLKMFLYTTSMSTVSDNIVPYTTFGGSSTTNATGIVQAVDRGTFPTGGGVKTVYQGATALNVTLTNPAVGQATKGVTGFWELGGPTLAANGTISIISGIAQATWVDYTFVFTGFLAAGSGNQAGATPGIPVLGYGIVLGSDLTFGAGAEKQGYTIATGGLLWVENFNLGTAFVPQNDGDTLTLGIRFKLGNVAAGTSVS